MTGPHDSIIGMEREPSLARFLNGMPSRFEPATGNPRLNGVIVDADDRTGRAIAVRRVSHAERELAGLEAGAAADLQAHTRVPALSEPAGRVEG
jgi:calcineurin-like phosphoesterase